MCNISVIIPVYNRVKRLKRAIESVLNQTYKNFELIVVDDGSTRDLSEIRNYPNRQSFKFIRNERNQGVSFSRNQGVKNSSGNWIAFLDSDDVWLESKLEKQIAFHEDNPKLRISQTKEFWFRNNNFVNPKNKHRPVSEKDDLLDSFMRSLELCLVSPSSVMIKKDLLAEEKGFKEEMRACEDYDLWLRILSKERIGLVDELLIKKYGGAEDQLSRTTPMLDKMRIYSLISLLKEQNLNKLQEKAVFDILAKKLAILSIGAKKRNKVFFANYYQMLEGCFRAKTQRILL